MESTQTLLTDSGPTGHALTNLEERSRSPRLPPSLSNGECLRTSRAKRYRPRVEGSEKNGGKTCYELESMDGAQSRDIIYAADGTVIEIEESVTPASLPASVAQALSTHFPNAPIKKAEKLIRGAVVEYEVVTTVGKQNNEVIMDEKGKILKVKKA